MNRLLRSSTDKVLFGVCGGIGRYMDIDPVLVRAGFVVLFFAGGSGLLAYIILAIIMPSDANATDADYHDQVEGEAPHRTARQRNALAAVLIVVGLVILLANLGAFGWVHWDIAWPLILIAIGVAIIAQRFRRSP